MRAMPAQVAIYEDDVGIRSFLLDLLEAEGVEVAVCGSVFDVHRAAIEGARVAIVDSWGASYLSLESGEREQIRALARLIPTILMSGRTWAAGTDASELGLVALVAKPFDLDRTGSVSGAGHWRARLHNADQRSQIERLGNHGAKSEMAQVFGSGA